MRRQRGVPPTIGGVDAHEIVARALGRPLTEPDVSSTEPEPVATESAVTDTFAAREVLRPGVITLPLDQFAVCAMALVLKQLVEGPTATASPTGDGVRLSRVRDREYEHLTLRLPDQIEVVLEATE